MHTKLVNNRIQDFKRRNRSSHEQGSFDSEEKENLVLQKYQRELEGKRSQRQYLRQAEKLILKERMKEIVAENVQYFRNILQANDVQKPNNLTLKLPGKAVPSLYQSEFSKKSQYQSQNTSIDIHHNPFNRTQNFSQSKLPLKTTYQNEFRKFQEIKQKRRPKNVSELFKRSITSNAPAFLDTQNSLQYRNWGLGSMMPSMKPKPQVATTDIPFKASSMYRTEFHPVTLPPKTQMITHEQTFPQSVDLWMGKSSYEKDFQRKKVRCQQDQNYRPKEMPGTTNLPFKSTSQYKKSFIESMSLNSSHIHRQTKKHDSVKRLSNFDIQKLVLDL